MNWIDRPIRVARARPGAKPIKVKREPAPPKPPPPPIYSAPFEIDEQGNLSRTIE